MLERTAQLLRLLEERSSVIGEPGDAFAIVRMNGVNHGLIRPAVTLPLQISAWGNCLGAEKPIPKRSDHRVVSIGFKLPEPLR
jgi:hypothetical protein